MVTVLTVMWLACAMGRTLRRLGKRERPRGFFRGRSELAGAELAKQTRDLQIVLSAHAMTDDRAPTMAAGGDDFDSKPIRFECLLAKIEALLAKSGAAS